ncbi:hypothetical protein [Thiocystis violacea]|uniref:hypothetical protein n=1 Tax=Thiocystis violacea TaxID=13725 RepID=UPI001904CBE3|nr:hypothetical protein [Thiocystis violacea]MBK1716831.1 hypothetical protein [Thiocystis violacea]
MKSLRLMTWLSAAVVAGALMTPALASAHGPRDHWRHDYQSERWNSPPPRHSKWSHRHRDHRGLARIHVDTPRQARRHGHPDRAFREYLGHGLTIIYR